MALPDICYVSPTYKMLIVCWPVFKGSTVPLMNIVVVLREGYDRCVVGNSPHCYSSLLLENRFNKEKYQ